LGQILGQFGGGPSSMWRTPQGNRTLSGVEAEVFRFALGSLVAELERDGAEHQSGVKSFDRLPLGMRWLMLDHISKALLSADVDPPMHTAASEAAICAVYEQLGFCIESEIESCEDARDEEPVTVVRTLAFHACKEIGLACGENPEDDNPVEWRFAVDDLMGLVLWDRDFDLGGLDLGSTPASGAGDLPPEYFSTMLPTPSDAEVKEIVQSLRLRSRAPS
jgi:hypothetical protein